MPPEDSILPKLTGQELIELSIDQKLALEQIPDMSTYGRCIFITGRAGTGKSTVLRELALKSPMKKVVLAPTGLAAINAGGQTIHSFFNFKLGPLEDDPDLCHMFKKGGQKHRLIKNLECLIIDEVSMVRADVMDAIDYSLRENRDIDEPFGGLTVICFGDLWQLEPVVQTGAEEEMIAHRYASPFFFDSDVVRETSLDVYELQTVHRQKDDPEFLYALNLLRKGDMSELDFFNSRVNAQLPSSNVLTLTATNAKANAINLGTLARLNGRAAVYKGEADGDFGKDFPVDPLLTLKVGAQIMFVKNSIEWVNGSLGTVLAMEPDELTVLLDDGRTVSVQRESWEKTKYTWDGYSGRIDRTPVGTYVQFPVKLAWAVTIHKSQGLTFDRVRIDMDTKAFAHGQLYVAMSRCRTLNGISLKRPISMDDCIVSSRILEFERLAGLS